LFLKKLLSCDLILKRFLILIVLCVSLEES
jgi:hypothetical protein